MVSCFRHPIVLLMSCIACASIVLSIVKGSVSLSLNQLLFAENQDILQLFFDLRLPRTLTAFTAGGLLALSGCLMQVLLQNPLADSYVLGTSSSALFFALLGILFGFSHDWMLLSAWTGCLISMASILLFARKHRWQAHSLLLLGIALAAGFSAAITAILLSASTNNLHSMLFWLTGDLNDARYPWVSLAILILGFIACQLLAPGLNVLGRGEKQAHMLGIAVQRYRLGLYLLSTLFTAAAVMLVGGIGFIGLIVPHIARRLIGYDHRLLLPTTCLLGGSLLTVADTASRTMLAPQQLPCGIIMSLIGVPLFIWLIYR